MAYTQTADGGRLRVTYTITPDLGETIHVGDTVTITGTIRHDYKPNDIKSFGVWFGSNEVKYINTNIDRNVTKNFTMTFEMPLLEGISSGSKIISFTIYNKSGGAAGGWTEQRQTDSTQSVVIANYSVHAEVTKFEVVRASYTSSGYVASNEGTYAWVKRFKITVDSGASYYDFDICRIKASTGDTEIINRPLSYSEFNQAITGVGYLEDVPLLLSGLNPAVTNDYLIVIEIGKSGEDISHFETTIPRAFANMHLSGAKKGGVAFGGFSNSTDDEPKFESFYKGSFPNGFDEKTCKMIGNLLYPVGSIYMNTQDTGWVNMPEQVFGGEWRLIDGGRVLVGPGEIDGTIVHPGDTGGSLTSQNITIPAHHHRVPVVVNQVSGSYFIGVSATGCVSAGTGSASDVFYTAAQRNTGSFSSIKYGNTSNASSQSATVKMSMPPYYVVNIYERTKLYDPVTGV